VSVEPEQIIDGRYRVKARVGSGGMADVFRAEDLQLGRDVAVKLLHERFAADEEFRERFRREASAAGGLQHPNVVGVYDRGEWNGTSYIAMEYLPGRTLKAIVDEEAPLDPARAIDIAAQVLRAARFAHKRGVIHRDLKPHNVIIDEEGRAKVTDFGIAQAGTSEMTETGAIMGTAQYLSPEQAQGQPCGAPSDLYSIGVLLYELLTGRVPFDGESAVSIAMKQVNEAPVPPSAYNPAVPPSLEHVVLRAMEKDPARRFADADEMLAALEAARAALPLGVGATSVGQDTQLLGVVPAPMPVPEATYLGGRPPVPPPLPPEEEDRRGWWIALGVGLLVVAAVVAALLLSGGTQVEVPRVVGAPEAAAKQALSRAGLASDVSRETSDTVPAGTVFGQDPAPGAMVDEGAVVQLVVSDGPGQARIPDLTNQGRTSARRALEDLGFRVVERPDTSDSVRTNRVIETIPAAGDVVSKGETVTLVVSTGAERVTVPDVVGQPRAQAERTLKDAGFDVSVAEQEDETREPGTVLTQDPAAEGQARKGATVTLTVAKAPTEQDIPDVRGQSQASATEALSGEGFTVRVREREVQTPDEDGIVLQQSPSGQAAPGATVTITVGRFTPDLNPDPQATQPQTTPDGGTTTTTPAP
jgi:serine/threonine-protein kinase